MNELTTVTHEDIIRLRRDGYSVEADELLRAYQENKMRNKVVTRDVLLKQDYKVRAFLRFSQGCCVTCGEPNPRHPRRKTCGVCGKVRAC